ncbi:MAG: valine--tRNA ligase [Treponema sp.]|nr:valine--tRNA ligase [Treponema sp.]
MEELEKRYDGQSIERKMQEFWAAEGIYSFDPLDPRPLYSIDTPPPTVSGSLHMGHIFSYTQAEMIARYRRMRGYNVFYPFGFDDNGLPSERLVEKELGIRAGDLSRKEFWEHCISITGRYEEEFMALWKSMGFSCDWKLLYSTISPNTQKLSQASFIRLAQGGHAYLKESPVLWCTECGTSIAQAELDSKETETFFHYIPFSIQGRPLEIATTRPELLPAVVCVFVHPEDGRYRELLGSMVKVPLFNFEVPLLADEKVDMAKGTGAVMCATYGDLTDVEWGELHQLPYKKVILSGGTMAEELPLIGGLSVKAARKEVVALLEREGLLNRSEELSHVVGVHERCGTEVEIIPSPQWYIRVLNKKEDLLKAGDRIKWHPEYMKARFVNWVEGLKWDWCISRQRFFGVPIPVWYCRSCGKARYAAPEELPVNPMENSPSGDCECGARDFEGDRAVLDTWATSSITPLINLDTLKGLKGEGDSFLPMGMRTQAHEIIRTWAFYTMVMDLYHRGDIPWKDIMICGFVLAKPGEKISKSKSNSDLSPQDLIGEYSADAIRYWAANARLGTDMYFDLKAIEEGSKRFMTKLWNSARFVLGHLQDFDPSYVPPALMPADRWIMERTRECLLEAVRHLDEYEVGLARKTADELFWRDLCDYYIEIVKDRLYKPELHGEEGRRSGQYAIYHCLLSILQIYAIYIPHQAEYIYQRGFKAHVGAPSIHLTQWDIPQGGLDREILEFGEALQGAIAEVRRYKTEHSLSISAELPLGRIKTKEAFLAWFKESEGDFKACTRVADINYELIDP